MNTNFKTRKWSTPIIIGSGIFVAISGVLMFFGIHNPLSLGHEWVGLLFAIGILLHIMNHWSPFKQYFSQKLGINIVAMITVVSMGLILLSSTQSGTNPKMNMFRSIENAPITEIAAIVDKPVSALVKQFESKGYTVKSVDQSAKDIALINGAEAKNLVMLMFSPSKSSI